MEEAVADKMFEEALAAVGDRANWADIDRAKTWRELDEQTFLGEYCWVVFAARFNVSIVERCFGELQEVFKQFEPDALSRMRRVPIEALPIRHEQKANCFLKGAKLVHKTGWSDFKARLEGAAERDIEEGINALTVLPWIKDVTKYHLAKNIGLADVAKPDVHLEWCAEHCSAKSVDELVAYLASKYEMTEHKVDAVLWEWRRVR